MNNFCKNLETSLVSNPFKQISIMAKKSSTKKNDKSRKLVAFFKAIAHPTRMGIVQLLLKEEKLTVNTICNTLDLEQSLTSHHLAGMRESGVLSSKRNGKNIYYMLSNPKIKDILASVEELI